MQKYAAYRLSVWPFLAGRYLLVKDGRKLLASSLYSYRTEVLPFSELARNGMGSYTSD